MSRRLQISFSGGETSAYLVYWMLRNRPDYDDVIVTFANTGQENEATLEFIHRCDLYFGFKTVWLEGVQNHGVRQTPTPKVVTFATASRDGTPFLDAISKYGIPNNKYKHCTRSLKTTVMENHARSIGWAAGTYDTAIGIRSDEIDRVSTSADKYRLVYPLAFAHPVTKPMINAFWSTQPFRLQLKGYQGNCKWCWKKSDRKLFTIMAESPEVFDFPRKMEQEFPRFGPEFKKDTPKPADYSRVFFRSNRSTDDMFRDYHAALDSGRFTPALDDAAPVDFDPSLDLGGGCEESCEVYADEDETYLAEEKGRDCEVAR